MFKKLITIALVLNLITFLKLSNLELYAQTIEIHKTDGSVSEFSISEIDSIIFPPPLKDIDGNIYKTVTIGTQVWMKENLKVTKYRNGDAIGTTTSTTIPNDSTSKYQWAYNGNDSNVATYGRLYTWWAVTDSRNVCPTGWHVPSDAEWCTLENFVEINTDPTCSLTGYRGTNTGGKMKEAGTSHWNSPNTGADNSSGFTALPGGYRSNNGTFYNLGVNGYWWSATEYNATDAWNRYLYYYYAGASRGYGYKRNGFSVRCLRD